MHIFPKGEESIHSPGDYCVCSPFATVDFHGQLTWHHQSLRREVEIDPLDLIEQAERVRMAESIDLWAKAELAGHKKLQVYRFASLNPIKMPGTTPRK